ncbi:MAG: hypothetical protein ABGX11_05150 [Candidatus Poseidoniia archaeon]|nr:MAG: hypothetical protein CXT65_03645 [Euryarchaeota archaeon]HIL44355.1 hypothetical protein [Candidatus Poseidoniales archaeon]
MTDAAAIEGIFYICWAIIWGLVNYPVPTIIILALFWWFFIKSESTAVKPRKPRKPLVDAYNRLINSVLGGAVESREDGIRILNEFGVANPERFFSSPYVIKTLGLKEELSKEPETVGDDWWEEGYSGDEGVVSDASPKTVVEMEPSPTPSTIEVGSEDACGEAGCSTAVTAFDFRCFTCRKRFCQSHAGSSVHCSNCES